MNLALRMVCGWVLLIAGLVGIALGGVQAVLDQRVTEIFVHESGGMSMSALFTLLIGGVLLMGGVLLVVASATKNEPNS